ncbi:Capsid protein VP1 like protein [Argiope bruennichi]|uniref:Capsid protein VP1 like protein n=1 Tax=Argiope bruennichi TaxID=94029 RepID=A0A8T0F2G5_ARGBR|nr:Capsid protein VP1 like protein [Argiope bruennichi]
MKPLSLEIIKPQHLQNLMNQFYGEEYDKNKIDTHWKKNVPTHQFGLPTVLNNYLTVVNTSDSGHGWPLFQQYLEEYNAENLQNTTICSMSYKPKVGLLKNPARSIFTGYPNLKPEHNRSIKIATGPIDPRGILTTFLDKDCDPVKTNGTSVARDDPSASMSYGGLIEKSNQHCRGLYESFNLKLNPLFILEYNLFLLFQLKILQVVKSTNGQILKDILKWKQLRLLNVILQL